MRTKWTLVAAGAAVCGAVAGPAGLAVADQSAAATISDLEARGYSVNIDRIGSGPTEKCIVTNVRNPQTVTQLVPYRGPGSGRRDNILVPVIVSQSISVTLDCSRT